MTGTVGLRLPGEGGLQPIRAVCTRAGAGLARRGSGSKAAPAACIPALPCIALPLHCIALRPLPLHCIALRCTTSTLHCAARLPSPLHCIALLCTPAHSAARPGTAPQAPPPAPPQPMGRGGARHNAGGGGARRSSQSAAGFRARMRAAWGGVSRGEGQAPIMAAARGAEVTGRRRRRRRLGLAWPWPWPGGGGGSPRLPAASCGAG